MFKVEESAKLTVSFFLLVKEGKEEGGTLPRHSKAKGLRGKLLGFPFSFHLVTVGILRCLVYLNGHFINKSLCFIHDIFVIYLDA